MLENGNDSDTGHPEREEGEVTAQDDEATKDAPIFIESTAKTKKSEPEDPKSHISSLNPFVLPSGAVKRMYVTSCPRGTTPPVVLQNPDTPFFDPYNHEAPKSDNTVHNQTVDYDGWTALHAAAQSKISGTHDKFKTVEGDVDQVRFLIHGRGHHVPAMVSFPHYSSPAIPVDSREVKRGFTPLHVAVCAGHSTVVEVLLKCKASVDARDCLGRTPLHWGCQTNHAESVAMMLGPHGGATLLGTLTMSLSSCGGLPVGDVHSHQGGDLDLYFVEVSLAHTDPRDPPPPPPQHRGMKAPTAHVYRRTQTSTHVRAHNGVVKWDSKMTFRLCPAETSIKLRLCSSDVDDVVQQLATWEGQVDATGNIITTSAQSTPNSNQPLDANVGILPLEVSGGQSHHPELHASFKYVKVIDEADMNGTTALMLAGGSGSLECTRLLLDAGARTDLKDSFDAGAAYRAAAAGHAEVCWLIEQKGGVW